MANLLVRNIDENVIHKLRQRAERHGHPLQEEVNIILKAAALENSGPVIGGADQAQISSDPSSF